MPDQLTFNNGLVTARSDSDLGPGELTAATGIYYKPGDTTRAHKIGGRATFGTVSASAAVNGLALCLFDDGGTDYLVAQSGTSLYRATPGLTGTFAAFVTGLDANTSSLSAIQADDKWYLATGYDRGYVLKSDGTSRRHGMDSPQVGPSFVLNAGVPDLASSVSLDTGVTVDRPTANSGSFTNPTYVYGTTETDYSHATLSAAGTTTGTWTTIITKPGTNTYTMEVAWQLAGYQQPTDSGGGQPGGGSLGTGGTTNSGFKCDVTISYAVNGGASVSVLSRTGITAAMGQKAVQQVNFSATQNDSVVVTVSLTYVSGTSQATLRHYYTKFRSGSEKAGFSTNTGFYYAFTEVDQVNGLESAPSDATPIVTFTSKNKVTLVMPAPVNSTTTGYNLYRTYDGGTIPDNLGYIKSVPAAAGNVYDDFAEFPVTEQPLPIVPLVTITKMNPDGSEGHVSQAQNTPPPAMKHLNYYHGSIVGPCTFAPRALAYSEAGWLDYFPEWNIIADFPLPENDRLVATVTIGDTLLVAAEGVMITLTDLPRVTNGQFNAAEAVPMKGQPGCVGINAITAFSVAGEARAAWVSPYGVHETNGQQARRISTDLDWENLVETTDLSEVVLHWDRNRQVLILCAPATDATVNNRFWLLHMSPEHEKQVGQPKWSGPHYGSIRCLASGRYSGSHRLYSGHPTSGVVYVEDYGTVDDSAAYSGSQVPLIATTGKMYEGYNRWTVYRGNLRHSNFGGSESCTVAWTAGTDAPGETQVVSQSVSLVNSQGTEFMVGRMGEWHQVTVTHTGAAQGSIQDIRLKARVAGDAGRVAV